jgi:hypothetical protein
MALTTLADNKTYMGITVNTYDAIIEMLRESTEQSVINYCETDFTLKTITNEVHDGINADVIVPKYFPIISIQKVMFDDLELGVDQYYYDNSGIILKGIVTPFARGVIKVNYTAGFASVPADVKLCVYQAVKSEYQRRERKTEDISSRSKEGESESFGSAWDRKSGLPMQIVSKLQAYRVYECPNIGMSQRNT